MSNLIQDRIQRQRYLELLQLELRMNHSAAVNDIKTFNDTGVIYNPISYQTKVYEAGFQSGYLLTLDPDIMGELYVFYSGYLPRINKINGHQAQIKEKYMQQWEECVINLSTTTSSKTINCDDEEKLMKYVDKSYSALIKDTAIAAEKTLWEVSLKFNPTQQRLNSPIMRLLMGNGRLEIQE